MLLADMDSASPPARFWLSPYAVTSAHRLMLAIVLTLIVANGLFGEKVPAGSGLGWDGVVYARMVRDLPGMITAGELGTYHAQRILPALIVRGIMSLGGEAPSDANIVLFFGVYNAVLLLICCLLWRLVCDAHQLSLTSRWVGFVGLFVNFQASKYVLYAPVLTDPTALTAGMGLLLLHAERRRIALALVAAAGAFCWPTLAVSGALLLLFPRADMLVRDRGAGPQGGWRAVLVGYLCLSVMAIAAYFGMRATRVMSCPIAADLVGGLAGTARRLQLEVPAHWQGPEGACVVVRQVLTGLPSLVGLAICLVVLLAAGGGLGTTLRAMRRIRISDVILAVLVLAGPVLLQRYLANEAVQNPSSIAYLARIIVLPNAGQFWMPVVGMAVYWGPLVLVALLVWRRFAAEAQRLGTGPVLVIGATLPFTLVGEGRFLTAAWPFVVLVVVRVLESMKIGRRFLVAYVLSSVAFAQFWLPLNIAPWTGGEYDGLQAFPKQMLLMHLGPWMNSTTYLLQSFLCVAVAAWLAIAGGLMRSASEVRPRRSD